MGKQLSSDRYQYVPGVKGAWRMADGGWRMAGKIYTEYRSTGICKHNLIQHSKPFQSTIRMTIDDIASLIRCSHEYTEDSLRCNLQKSLPNILLASQVRERDDRISQKAGGSIRRFDEVSLRSHLRRIDWKQLCSEHNTFHGGHDLSSKSSNGITKPTTLDMLLECFENPCIWPSACIASLFCVLGDVLCNDDCFRNVLTNSFVHIEKIDKAPLEKLAEWTPAQYRIFTHMTEKILNRNSYMLNNAFWTNVQHLTRISTPYQGEITFRMLRHWYVEFPDCKMVLLSLLAKLMASLDAYEDSLVEATTNVKKGEPSTASKHVDDINNEKYYLKRKREHSIFNYQYLHGELSEDQLDNLDRLTGKWNQTSCDNIVNNQDTWRAPNTSATSLLDLWKLRAKCIHLLLTWARRITSSWTIQKPVPFQSDPLVAIFHELLDTISTHPNSWTVRLSPILLAELFRVDDFKNGIYCCRNDGHEILLQLVWMRATNGTKISEVTIFIRYFAELIAVCSRYDDRETLFAAINPLLLYIADAFPAHTLITTSRHDPQRYRDTRQIYRTCFAFILSSRGNILISPSSSATSLCSEPIQQAEKLLIKLITQFSLKFDQYYDWIDSSMSKSDCNRLVRCLKRNGILGLDSTVKIIDGKHKNDISPLTRAEPYFDFPWFNSHPTGKFESMLRRLDLWLPHKQKGVDFKTVLSHYGAKNMLQSFLVKADSKLGTMEHTCITDFLQDDLTLTIFSFLPYKRLAQMRLICVNWKELADKQSLWYSLYIRRFKPKDQVLPMEKNDINWKKLYIDRRKAERSIRFRTCRKDFSWKVRLCNHISCLVVLTSPTMMLNHFKKHDQETLSQKKIYTSSTGKRYSKQFR
jgi:F-box-like